LRTDCPPKPLHAQRQIRLKPDARLLAVVDHIDAALDLLVDNVLHRVRHLAVQFAASTASPAPVTSSAVSAAERGSCRHGWSKSGRCCASR